MAAPFNRFLKIMQVMILNVVLFKFERNPNFFYVFILKMNLLFRRKASLFITLLSKVNIIVVYVPDAVPSESATAHYVPLINE